MAHTGLRAELITCGKIARPSYLDYDWLRRNAEFLVKLPESNSGKKTIQTTNALATIALRCGVVGRARFGKHLRSRRSAFYPSELPQLNDCCNSKVYATPECYIVVTTKMVQLQQVNRQKIPEYGRQGKRGGRTSV
jgi:hypothetical protein